MHREFIYQHPTDDVAALATLTPSTEDPNFPIENLVSADPSDVAKWTDNEGDVVLDFGSPQRVDVVAAIYNSIGPTSGSYEVKFQGNTTSSWSTPPLDVDLVQPATFGNGHRNNPWADLTEADGYLVSGYRFYRFSAVGAGAPSANLAIGRLWLGAQRRSFVDLGAGLPDSEALVESVAVPAVEGRTEGDKRWVYPLRTFYKAWSLNLLSSEGVPGHDALLAWFLETIGAYQRFLLIPDVEAANAHLCRWAMERLVSSRPRREIFSSPIAIEEDVYGIPL